VPRYLNPGQVTSIVRNMVVGYGLFCLVHFPMNGFVFRRKGARSLLRLSVAHVLGALAFAAVLSLFLHMRILSSYQQLVTLIFSYLALLIVFKTTSILSERRQAL
jgi:hypothetical protein